MPWHLPDDMDWFKRQTMGKPVIMGRKTYESIPARFRPLVGRKNIILTHDRMFVAPDCTIAHTIDDAVAIAPATVQEVMVIGGGTLYEQFLQIADRLYLTLIDHQFAPAFTSTYFPAYDVNLWQETYREKHEINGRHAHRFIWLILERKKA